MVDRDGGGYRCRFVAAGIPAVVVGGSGRHRIVCIAAPDRGGAGAEMQTNVPEALSHRFVVAVTLTSLLFWALLGSLSGALYRRFAV
jgi:predicted cobalt transporter CbtA